MPAAVVDSRTVGRTIAYPTEIKTAPKRKRCYSTSHGHPNSKKLKIADDSLRPQNFGPFVIYPLENIDESSRGAFVLVEGERQLETDKCDPRMAGDSKYTVLRRASNPHSKGNERCPTEFRYGKVFSKLSVRNNAPAEKDKLQPTEKESPSKITDDEKAIARSASQHPPTQSRPAEQCETGRREEAPNQLTYLNQLSGSANADSAQRNNNNTKASDGLQRDEQVTQHLTSQSHNVRAGIITSVSLDTRTATDEGLLRIHKIPEGIHGDTVGTKSNTVTTSPANSYQHQRKQSNEHVAYHKTNMSTAQVLKLLRQFNMTLKAVPADSDIARSIRGATRAKTAAPATDEDSRIHTSHLKTYSRSTAVGTFRKWRLDDATQSKTHRTLPLKCRETTNSNLTARRFGERVSRENRCRAKKRAHSSDDVIDLSTAFHDLENRDRAAKETMEIFAGRSSDFEVGQCSPNLNEDPLLTSAAFTTATEDDHGDRLLSEIHSADIDSARSPSAAVDADRDLLQESLKRDEHLTGSSAPLVKSTQEPPESNRINTTVEHRIDQRAVDISDAPHDEQINDRTNLLGATSQSAQTWNPNEVLSWLSSTIQQYPVPSDSIPLSKTIASPRRNLRALTQDIFSRVRDADGLLTITLHKLKQVCPDDSLARYLFKRVQALSIPHQEKGDGMHGVGQCAVTAPPSVNTSPMEQFEESVNIDDLFGGDIVYGSSEFSEYFDSQAGSYLKYLGGNDYLHASVGTRSYDYPPASLDLKSSSQGEEHGAMRIAQHFRRDASGFGAHVLNGSAYDVSYSGKSSSNCSPSGIYGDDTAGGDWSIANFQTTCHSYQPPVSPSTFYNIPAANSSGKHHVRESRDNGQNHTSRCLDVVLSCRETSDNDSGIYSPELHSPHKASAEHMPPSRNPYKYSESSWGARGLLSCKKSPGHYNGKAGWAVKSESVAAANWNCSSERWCDEKCDRSSTSSSAAAVESKLLNMDECKPYSTYELTNVIRQMSPTATYTTPHYPSKDNFHVECGDRQSRIGESFGSGAQNRNVTTIYPPFLLQMQRAASVNDSGRDDSVISHTPVSNVFQDSVTGINGEVNPALSNYDDHDNIAEHSASGGTRNRQISSRRHTTDTSDSFMDSLELKIRRTSGKSVTLWEFIRDTLLDPKYCPRLIKWEDRKAGIFRFVQSDVVAGMWGDKKNNPKMTYEKLSRAMRYYYNRGILERVDGRRLVYKFGRNAHGWQQSELQAEVDKTGARYACDSETCKEERAADPQPVERKSRKSKPRISVSVCDEVVPPTKISRTSCSSSPTYFSMERSTDNTLNSAGFCEQTAAVNLEKSFADISSEEIKIRSQPAAGSPSPAVSVTEQQPSCIVYVARRDVMSSETTDEKDIMLLENARDLPSAWTQDTQDASSSKLPSADVLLGKQYKIANAVM